MELLEMKNIRKSFFGVEVLHGVDFKLKAGQVHALIGENGAGKSTLMKVLMGEYIPDGGEVFLGGKQVNILSPSMALSLGINKVHQELSPVLDMTVTDNIFLGKEKSRKGFVRKKEQEKEAGEIFARLGLSLDPSAYMRDLSVAETQMVEIAKAVSFNCKILILDEPTAAITNLEVEKLYEIIRLLKKRGVGIIYISHKLEELYEIADSVTVLRDGNFIMSDSMLAVPRQKLIHAMVGREIKDLFPERRANPGDVILEARHISRKKEFQDVSFSLRRGEVLGLSGLMGAGRTEICMALFGASRLDGGQIMLYGREASIRKPKDAIRQKIALITEDRKLQGLNLIGTVQDNILSVVQKRISTLGFVRKKESERLALDMVSRLQIKVHSLRQHISNLSGGNQQKVVIAKWSLSEPEIIIFDEPTRGVDIGAKAEIYKLMNEFAEQGKAVIMVSSEMPEIIGMCDRVLVLHEGKLKGELLKSEMTQENIMNLATE